MKSRQSVVYGSDASSFSHGITRDAREAYASDVTRSPSYEKDHENYDDN